MSTEPTADPAEARPTLITRLYIGGRQFGPLGWLGFAGLSLIVAIAAAAAIYRWVDEPLMRRFAGRRAVRPPATTRDPVDRVTASVGP
ncbi:hypothetical protein [Nocardia sp. CA-120079]|uniref:hypothetical protein n=1 Tax=Nocardia sp. CA-120079 TaxID=3239974 RepID=UPI003D96D5AF